MQFSLTPGKIGLAFFVGTVLYIISAPLLGKVADKAVSQITIVIVTILILITGMMMYYIIVQ